MFRRIIVVVMVSLLWVGPSSAEMVIIVNKANPADSVSMDKVAKFYKGLLQIWEGTATKVQPVELQDANPLAEKFTATVMKMNMEQKRNMWIKVIFSGQGTPPPKLKDDAAVVSYVASEPGAIGYVDKGSVTDSVKVITVDGKREF